MLKNKIKIILFMILVIISFFTPIVSADNETSNDDVVAISEEAEETEEVTIRQDDYYVFDDNVIIDQPIDGNVFIFAETVTINTQIGGDAFIIADTITIEENGYIFSNLFACAESINIKGALYNIYTVSTNLTIDGFIYRDVRSTCNSLNINGMIGRNVFVACDNIHFKELSEEDTGIATYGTIQGNLTYSSDEEFYIPDGAVSGETTFNLIKDDSSSDITSYIFSMGTLLVSAIIIWLISLWFLPKISYNTNLQLSVLTVLQIIGLGILVPFIISLLTILVIITPITTQLSILFIGILIILFFISNYVTIIYINNRICNKLKISQNVHKLGFLILTALVFWLLTLIPYLGTIIALIAVIWGIGLVSHKLLITEKTIKKNNPEKQVEDKPKKDSKKNDEKTLDNGNSNENSENKN